MRRQSAARAICGALLSLAVAGCSFPSDYFGRRVVEYNREAEDATLSAMLLNIVRASQRRPMQFTGLQSVTGSSSTSGSINGGDTNAHTSPLIGQYGLAPPATSTVISRVVTGTVGGSASISGGPTFTVPVLDTQEFYQGILTPIPLSVIDFYLEQGFPPGLLADIFVLSIVVTRVDDGGNCQQFTFTNSPASDLQFGQFQAMVDYLVASGFIAERVSRTSAFGPELPKPRAADAARAVDAYAHAAQAGLDFKKGKGGRFTLERKSTELRTCFIYKGGAYPAWLAAKDKSIFCGNFGKREPGGKSDGDAKPAGEQCTPKKKPATRASVPTKDGANYDSREQGVTSDGQSEFRGIALAPAVLDRIAALQKEQMVLTNSAIPYDQLFPVSEFRGAHISMKFRTRSTEGILYYLGELVRRSLNPEHATPRVLQAKSGINYGTYPMRDCTTQEPISEIVPLSGLPRYRYDAMIPVRCENIFVVNPGPSIGNNVVSVMYNGTTYSVPHDRETGGRSSQIFELVKQVLALNTSAKQLPSTTVISVVGAQ
jgi:hypothetical protein